MKIAILSDSHDNLVNLEKAIDYLNEQSIKRMIFCGDFCSPIPVKTQFSRFDGQIDAVFGNTEDRHLITKISLTEVKNLNIHGELAKLDIDDVKIAVTHYPEYAEAFAKTERFDLVCHGHTHTAREEMIGGTKLINPGEIMGFKEDARFVLFDTESGESETIFIRDIK